VQLGQGTSAGTQAHGFIVRIHMQLYPTHICVKVDFRNAFNTIERARMVEAFANDTELNDMHLYMESRLRPRSRIYYLSGGYLIRAEYTTVCRAANRGLLRPPLGSTRRRSACSMQRTRPSHQLVDAQEPLVTI